MLTAYLRNGHAMMIAAVNSANAIQIDIGTPLAGGGWHLRLCGMAQ
jgi:hypothetical protein